MLRTITIFSALLFLACSAFGQGVPDGLDRPIADTERKEVIDSVLALLKANYVFPELAEKMAAAIQARLAKNEYNSITSSREFAKTLTTHLREVSKDQHLSVDYFPNSLPNLEGRRPEPSPEDLARARARRSMQNFGFQKAERLEGGVGLLVLEGFNRAEGAAETAAAAMNFMANSSALIIDLRKNGGGDPAMSVLLCSYFFGDQTHLNDIYERANNTTRQYWSHPHVAGKKFVDKDIYILTSRRTFSAAEEFTYNMQSQKRATIVGETTGGGAHPTRGHRATEHFGVAVPYARSINPVTKTNWEGTGVKPDVDVPADQALHTAHLIALKKAREKCGDDRVLAERLTRTITEKEAELAATQQKPGRHE
jgi:C-terminal processing protease CtpA/Prc